MTTLPPTPPAPTLEPPSLIPSAPGAQVPDSVSSQPNFDLGPGEGNPNAFRLVFPDIALYARQRKWSDIIQTAEKADLNKVGGDWDPTRLLIIGPLVLAYLIVDDLAPARFALTRLPSDLAQRPLPQALFNLLASTTDRKYANIYTRATALQGVLNAPQEASGVDVELAIVLRDMLEQFLSEFRQRTLALLHRVYTSISLSDVQTYVEAKPNIILQVAKESGQWAYEPNTQLLTPIRSPPGSGTPFSSRVSDLITFNSVSAGAIDLESAI